MEHMTKTNQILYDSLIHMQPSPISETFNPRLPKLIKEKRFEFEIDANN